MCETKEVFVLIRINCGNEYSPITFLGTFSTLDKAREHLGIKEVHWISSDHANSWDGSLPDNNGEEYTIYRSVLDDPDDKF